jgi:hypothetical protein
LVEFEYYGTIRRGSTAPYDWYVIDDDGHQPLNMGSIVTTDTYVEIVFPIPAVEVGFIQVTPDESFIKTPDVRVGASVGFTSAKLFFAMDSTTAVINPRQLSRANTNVWVTGKNWVA